MPLNLNFLLPIGSNLSLGGLPFGHGASPYLSIHFPISALRSSVHPLQNEFDKQTTTSPSPSQGPLWLSVLQDPKIITEDHPF